MGFHMIMSNRGMEKKAKLCYMDTNRLIVYMKTEENYVYNANNVETKFDTSNYEI